MLIYRTWIKGLDGGELIEVLNFDQLRFLNIGGTEIPRFSVIIYKEWSRYVQLIATYHMQRQQL